MLRLCSKGCEYAIRALLYMDATGGRRPVVARAVCRKAGIPESFTRKVFQALVRGKFLKAVPGPGGGYAFTRPPSTITVRHVIESVDGREAFRRCILGLPTCSDRRACPLHETWTRVKRRLLSELEATTLRDLMDAMRS